MYSNSLGARDAGPAGVTRGVTVPTQRVCHSGQGHQSISTQPPPPPAPFLHLPSPPPSLVLPSPPPPSYTPFPLLPPLLLPSCTPFPLLHPLPPPSLRRTLWRCGGRRGMSVRRTREGGEEEEDGEGREEEEDRK